MLERIGDEIWIADGPTVSFFGFPYPTRMAVVRLGGDGLWIWSPVGLWSALRTAVAALGTPRWLVAPNKLHHLFLAEWKHEWPAARLYAAPGLAARRRDLAFDAELSDGPPAEWAEEIDQVVVGGSLVMHEVLFFHRRSRTALACDLVQRFDPETLPPLRRWIMRLDGLVGPHGSTPREWRASFLRRGRARAAAERALAWNPERLVIAHGQWAPTHGRDVLRTGLRWLNPRDGLG